jgi:tetratricopeptide (TPR) repeat protein
MASSSASASPRGASAAHAASSSSSSSSGIAAQLKPVAQLAAPRGVQLTDELTGKAACFSLEVAGLAYYYQTVDSCELDYSVLSHVGPLLADLAAENAAQGTAQEREMHRQRARRLQLEIARVTLELASSRIISKDFERAKPAALRCLRMLTLVHGEASSELVPAYLALAEAALGMGAADKAEEFLSLSSFVLSKQQAKDEQRAAERRGKGGAADGPRAHHTGGAHAGGAHAHHGGAHAGHASLEEEAAAASAAAAVLAAGAMQSRLHRNFGRLYMSQGNLGAAVGAFSHDILHCARATGPESIEASPGYFNLGKAFAAQGKSDAALACFDKVVECWHMHLTGRRSAVARVVASLANRGGSASGAGAEAAVAPALTRRPLGAVEAAEGLEILAEVSAAREAKFGASALPVAEVRLTAALILDATGEGSRAGPLLQAALGVFRSDLPAGHELTTQAEALLEKTL